MHVWYFVLGRACPPTVGPVQSTSSVALSLYHVSPLTIQPRNYVIKHLSVIICVGITPEAPTHSLRLLARGYLGYTPRPPPWQSISRLTSPVRHGLSGRGNAEQGLMWFVAPLLVLTQERNVAFTESALLQFYLLDWNSINLF